MAEGFELIEGGSVTSPQGFRAGGVFAGLKTPGEGVLDLGMLVSDRAANVAGTFSTNRILVSIGDGQQEPDGAGHCAGGGGEQRLRELRGRGAGSPRRGGD